MFFFINDSLHSYLYARSIELMTKCIIRNSCHLFTYLIILKCWTVDPSNVEKHAIAGFILYAVSNSVLV